jgi:hypothetical protein
MSGQFDASCLCAGITLSYSGVIGPANYCHCEDCRRATGSAFNVAVRVERKSLVVRATSELRRYESVSSSGGTMQRCFCGTCGSPIFTLHAAHPDYAWVKAGIIRQPDVVQPRYESWVKDKVSWATIRVTDSYEERREAQPGR